MSGRFPNARWAVRAIAAEGNDAEIFDRYLGAGSPLGLPRGLSALYRDGGILYTAYIPIERTAHRLPGVPRGAASFPLLDENETALPDRAPACGRFDIGGAWADGRVRTVICRSPWAWAWPGPSGICPFSPGASAANRHAAHR